MKKITPLLLALVLVTMTLPIPSVIAEETLPELTIAICASSVEDFETNLVTLAVEEEIGCDLHFDIYPASGSEARAKFAVVANSGSDLPDILAMNVDASVYGPAGVLAPLDEYYANPEVAHYFSQLTQEHQEYLLSYNRQYDGHVYGMPWYNEYFWNEANGRLWINRTWLDALNFEVPQTTDELRAVLEAFVTQDPNGNEKADEIGILGSYNGWATDPIQVLMGAFLPVENYPFLLDEEGKISAAFVTDEWKAGLQYMADLVKDGLLDPMSFTIDKDQQQALLNSDPLTVGLVVRGDYETAWPDWQNNESLKNYELMAPVAGPEGVRSILYAPSGATSYWYITTSCDDVELAFRVGDWFFDMEHCLFSRFGVEDVNWTTNPEVMAQYLEGSRYSVDDLGYIVISDAFFTDVQNVTWGGVNPGVLSGSPTVAHANVVNGVAGGKEGSVSYEDQHKELYLPLKPDASRIIGKLTYNEEETEELALYTAVIDPYVTESAAAFITANKSFDEWDSYIAELNAMGLERYLELKQIAYDRK